MLLVQVVILAIVQGLTELLPVSSSAHVIVAEKLMGLDPSSPPMTLLLVMLHTGTMFAVIAYFWHQWRNTYFQSATAFKQSVTLIVLATVLTGIVGELCTKVIEKTIFRGLPKAQVEDLFSHLELIAPALAAVGILILISGIAGNRNLTKNLSEASELNVRQAGVIGIVQGMCLPFRGFSRSGATISTGILMGAARSKTEIFSFALAVVLTPAVVDREAMRLLDAERAGATQHLAADALPSLLGAIFAFFAGLLALKWLTRWLEGGRWYLFGIYCLFAAAIVAALHHLGY
jgi:undecaprenyl-diphosphatase